MPSTTRHPGFVYIAQLQCPSRYIKIGHSTDVAARLRRFATDCPYDVQLLGVRIGSVQDERALHRAFDHLRLPSRAEWFGDSASLVEYARSLPALDITSVPTEQYRRMGPEEVAGVRRDLREGKHPETLAPSYDVSFSTVKAAALGARGYVALACDEPPLSGAEWEACKARAKQERREASIAAKAEAEAQLLIAADSSRRNSAEDMARTDTPGRRGPKLTHLQRLEILGLASQGMLTNNEIAKLYGVTRVTVDYLVRKYGQKTNEVHAGDAQGNPG